MPFNRHTTIFAVVLAIFAGACLFSAANDRKIVVQADRDEKPRAEIDARFVATTLKFVKWPKSCYADASAPTIVGVLGDDEVESYLEDLIEKRNSTPTRSKRRTTECRRIDPNDLTAATLSQCHLIYIGQGSLGSAARVMAAIEGKPILVMSPIDRFSQIHGGIELRLIGKNVKLYMNFEKIKARKLRLKPSFVKLAKVVEGGK